MYFEGFRADNDFAGGGMAYNNQSNGNYIKDMRKQKDFRSSEGAGMVGSQGGIINNNYDSDENKPEPGQLEYDDQPGERIQKGPITLKNGATYTGDWLNNQRDGFGH